MTQSEKSEVVKRHRQHIGRWLKSRRERCGWTRRQLAWLVGCSASLITMLENAGANLTLDNYLMLRAALNGDYGEPPAAGGGRGVRFGTTQKEGLR